MKDLLPLPIPSNFLGLMPTFIWKHQMITLSPIWSLQPWLKGQIDSHLYCQVWSHNWLWGKHFIFIGVNKYMSLNHVTLAVETKNKGQATQKPFSKTVWIVFCILMRKTRIHCELMAQILPITVHTEWWSELILPISEGAVIYPSNFAHHIPLIHNLLSTPCWLAI